MASLHQKVRVGIITADVTLKKGNPMENYWKNKAQHLPEDYQKGNSLESQLLHHLETVTPEILEALKRDDCLQEYLQVKAATCQDNIDKLIDQGSNGWEAKNQAVREMLPMAADEAEETPEWENEGALTDVANIALESLGD